MNGRLGMTGDGVVRGDAVYGRVVAKREGRERSGTAIGAGSVLGTVGLVGGGIPKVKANRLLVDVKNAPARRTKVANAARAYRGGEFGYRHNAHQTFKEHKLTGDAPGKATRAEHYAHGDTLGRRAAEDTIIRHLKVGRTASNVALAGGAALVGGGLIGHRKQVAKRENRRNDALVSGGLTTAGLGGGGSLVLDSQGRKWSARSATHLDAAQKHNPKLGGYDVERKKGRVPDIKPHLRSGDITANHHKIFAGRSKEHAQTAGQLRGVARQARYFGGVYGDMARAARKVGAAGALVGAAGLGAKHLNGKPREVAKNLASLRGARIPGAAAVTDNQGRIVFLSELPKVHPGEPQRVLATVRRPKRTLTRSRSRAVAKVDTTMSEHEAGKLAARYDTRGPLPKGMTREAKMKAYEGRYIAAGGKKGEKWKRRADRAEVGRNIGLAGATVGAAALLAARGKKTGPKMAGNKVLRHVTPHRTETVGLGSALGGGWSELYGEHARSRRASYANSPAGVAGSALSRMQAYTPKARTP